MPAPESQINPFKPLTGAGSGHRPHRSDECTLVHRTLLYREIEFHGDSKFHFLYDGWWFRQKILINGELCWFRISWLKIHRTAEFIMPASTPLFGNQAEVSIEFNRALWIKRFRLQIGGEVVYDERH